MNPLRAAYSEYKNSLRRGISKRIDYDPNSQALSKEKEIFTALRNRISPHVPNGDIVYRLNEKFYEVYLVFNRGHYEQELIMNFSLEYKLGNQKKIYVMDVDFGTSSHAADFFEVFNIFCNLRLYCRKCNYHFIQNKDWNDSRMTL